MDRRVKPGDDLPEALPHSATTDRTSVGRRDDPPWQKVDADPSGSCMSRSRRQIHDPHLARAVFGKVEIGKRIPRELFQPVIDCMNQIAKA
jgi:hypothetical protein